jgi:RNA polymerase sigma factor (sigma-70 family)
MMASEALIARCIREDRKAQQELYRALYPMMMSVCSRYERNRQDAQARVNSGFLKILQNLERRKSNAPFEFWARRIIINTVIDGYREDRQRREHEIVQQEVATEDHATANEYLAHMEAEAFEVLVQALPPVSRHVFNLFAMDGYSHKEIAELLGISTGTSKWHVAHARSILQQALCAMAREQTTVR